MISILRSLVAVGFLVPLLLLSPIATAGTPKSTITITPFLHEVRFLAEEATKDFTINISNSTKETQKFNLSVLDFGSLDESGGVVFAGSDASTLVKKYGLATWLQLSEKSLSLAPNETKEIKASIVNHSTMTPGGHYAAIVASIDSSGRIDGNEININQQLSSLILATKVGGEKYDLKLTKISSNASWLRLPNEVALEFTNPGNVHVVPRGTVKLLATNGREVASGVINTESSFIFPETSRKITVDLTRVGSADIWPAKYKLQVDYRYEGFEQIGRKEQEIYYTNLVSLGFILGLTSIGLGIIWKTGSYKKLFKARKKA